LGGPGEYLHKHSKPSQPQRQPSFPKDRFQHRL
jgi:hypothetical protein